jgi:hypothetical protein
MKSILQDEKECYAVSNHLIPVDYTKCSRYANLEEHHIFFGTANRKLSEKYGMKVWLCPWMHRGDDGVHNNRMLDLMLKEMAQKRFEEYYKGTYNRSDFIRIFGKSYL